MLKHETEENITECLKQQRVTACKRFRIKKRREPDRNKYIIINIQHHFFT